MTSADGQGDIGPRSSRQATVAAFDAATGAGQVLLDDGSGLAFGPAAFAASGLRTLRVGQRVRLELTGDPGAAGGERVSRLTILTLP